MANGLTVYVSALVLLAWALPASAQVPADIWGAAGVTGIVDEADKDIYQFNSTGSVSIKYSVPSGTLDLRYPIQTMPAHEAPAGSCTELRAVLRDTGPGARVILRVMQLGIGHGLDGQLTSLGGIDSDTTPRRTKLGQPSEYAFYSACLNVPSPRPFDFAFYTYYVEAQLIKTTASGNPGPGLMAVQICHTTEQCEP